MVCELVFAKHFISADCRATNAPRNDKRADGNDFALQKNELPRNAYDKGDF
ncbi:MAG: hypothetical protein LBG21_03085 [Campylobacteraceae bacterium]|nr:hypothetical protein [Campylobacteraceae bacterium]